MKPIVIFVGNGVRRAWWPMRIQSAANLREHWARKARRVKHEKADAVVFALATLRKPIAGPHHGWSLPVLVKLTRIAPRPLDLDNAVGGMKAHRDAIATFLGVDDGDESSVQWAYAQRRGAVGEYALEVEIAELAAVANDEAERVREFDEVLP